LVRRRRFRLSCRASCTGGEYAVAITFVCEYAPDKRRGFFASFLDMGSYKLSDRIGRRPVLWIGAGSTILFAVPAFLLIGIGSVWSTLAGLSLVAFPVTFLRGQPHRGWPPRIT
jgi:MFS family permease